MREPFVSVSWNGRDLVPVWGPLLISVTVTDERGVESDKVTIELDAPGDSVEAPEPGEVIQVIGGYLGEGGMVQGEYEVDTIDLEGWPEKITINGTSASAKKANKEKKNEAHRKKDTPDIRKLVEKIAGRNGWTARVADEVGAIPVEYEGQSTESDLGFLNRVLGRYGALVAVKQNRLVVTKKGAGKSASGADLSALAIAPGLNLKKYSGSIKKRPEHKKTEASVFDRKKVKRVDVKAGEGEITYRFREPFKNEAEAKKAAESKLSDLARGTASWTFTIEGEPAAAAEEPVEVSGVKTKVNGRWNPTKVEHRWVDGGYETVLQCEAMDAGAKKSSGSGTTSKAGSSIAKMQPSTYRADPYREPGV